MARFLVSADPQPSQKSARPAGAKIWFFRAFTAIVIPLFLLLLFEGALRLAGFGRPTGFFIPDERPGFVRTNPDYVSLFMPGNFDLRQLNYRIAVKKPPGTLRVFVLGESAVEGIPAPAFAFVPQLRARLRHQHSDKNIEVINTGVVAINSHVVYQIAREAARYEPDLFVVYMGNNEVVGPYGPGCAYLSQMWPVWLIRLNVAVRSTRTGQLLGAVMARLSGPGQSAQEWGGMAMFIDHAVCGDDPRLAAVGRNFETNLRDIVQVARDAGAKTILCTPVSNLKDCPPFLSLHRPDLAGAELAAWRAAFTAGKLAWKLDETDEARRQLEEAWRLDPQYADTAFMLGSLEHKAGHLDEARKLFVAAQQWDALRFRPSPELNDIVREVARHSGVMLTDTDRLLGSAKRTTGESTGRELMFEHVHPDWEGNRRIAGLLAGDIDRALFHPEYALGGITYPASFYADAVGYTPVERFGVLQRAALITREPPFTNQLTYLADQARTAREIAAADAVRRDPAALRSAYDLVRRAVANDPDSPDLARLAVELADQLGDLPAALAEVRRAQTLQPANFALFADEAIKLVRLGRAAEAEKLLLATAAGCTPRDRAKLAVVVADFYSRTKRHADGLHWFDEAVAREPESRALRFSRGALAHDAQNLAAAERDYRAVLAADPAHETAQEALVALLMKQGKSKDAEEQVLAAAETQPRNQANNLRAAVLCEARDDKAQTVRFLVAATTSGPVPTATLVKIATLLYRAGETEKSLDYLAEARRSARDEGDTEVVDTINQLVRRIRPEIGAASSSK